MCMEDVNIGRKTSSRMLNFAVVNTGSQEILPGSPYRYALIFTPPQAGRVTLTNESPAVLDIGMTLVSAGGPFAMTIQDHGDIVRKPWYAIASIAGTLNVIEVILTES